VTTDKHDRTRWHRRTHLSAALMAVAVAGLVTSACSSGPGTPSVAGLPGSSTTTAQSGGGLSQGDGDMVAFARCMRAHGVRMSDPVHVPGHSGLSFTDLPPEYATTQLAYGTCNHFLQGLVAAKGAAAAARSAPHLQALTNYAQCMRDHDIDMLDPNSQGSLNLGDVPGIISNYGRYSPQFRAADSGCRQLLPAGVHDDGSGP